MFKININLIFIAQNNIDTENFVVDKTKAKSNCSKEANRLLNELQKITHDPKSFNISSARTAETRAFNDLQANYVEKKGIIPKEIFNFIRNHCIAEINLYHVSANIRSAQKWVSDAHVFLNQCKFNKNLANQIKDITEKNVN